MKQKMMFLARGAKWCAVAADAVSANRAFQASHPNPAEACLRKPRREEGRATHPEQPKRELIIFDMVLF